MDQRLSKAIAEIEAASSVYGCEANYGAGKVSGFSEAIDILRRHFAEPDPLRVALEALVQEWGSIEGASYNRISCSYELHKLLAEHKGK